MKLGVNLVIDNVEVIKHIRVRVETMLQGAIFGIIPQFSPSKEKIMNICEDGKEARAQLLLEMAMYGLVSGGFSYDKAEELLTKILKQDE